MTTGREDRRLAWILLARDHGCSSCAYWVGKEGVQPCKEYGSTVVREDGSCSHKYQVRERKEE